MYKLVALIGLDKRNALVIVVRQHTRSRNPGNRGVRSPEAGTTANWWSWR